MEPTFAARVALVVDDDVDIREFLIDVLEAEGFFTRAAHNGRRALEILSNYGNVDLLISDVLMPDMDGLELLQRARALCKTRNQTLKAILISGGGLFETGKFYLSSANLLGADRTLTKPFSASDLRRVLNELGFTEQNHSQPPA